MCIFSQRVEHVGATRIFARALPGGGQALVYEMTLRAATELAMVLPLPIARGGGDPGGSVRFVDLSGYPEFFAHLERGFPRPQAKSATLFGGKSAPLPVERVGAFDASFVPAPSDFSRLDPRFRLPDPALATLPDYADWGFAVFKLAAGEHRVHPMALVFAPRDRSALFFPTVHVHDGARHATADFDHVLYCQTEAGAAPAPSALGASASAPPARPDVHWGGTGAPASQHVEVGRTQGLVDAQRELFSGRLAGRRANADLFVRAPVA